MNPGKGWRVDSTTPQQVEEQLSRIGRIIDAWGKNIAVQVQYCPECEDIIEKKTQRGRCVYAWPCGCFLYRGSTKT